MFGFKKKDPLAGLDSLSEGEGNKFDSPPTQEQTGLPPEMPAQQRSSPMENMGEPYQMPSSFDQVREVQQPEQAQTYPQQSYSTPQSNDRDKDLELISSKLDLIKSMIETLSHRMSSLEQRMEVKKGW